MKKAICIIGTLILLLPNLAAQDYYAVRPHTRITTGGLDQAVAIPYLDDGIVYITESTSVGASSPQTAEGRRLFTIFHYSEGGNKKPFLDAIVSQRHDGPVSFTADFNTMVFSQQRPSGANRDFDPLGLYFAERVDGNWVNFRPYEYNDDFAWLFAPALSPDGRTLFFAANFPDGQGGFDLYRSTLKSGSWTKPENLGPDVNTAENELYPFMHSSGRLLFSSDGHDGRTGGFDLFETKYQDGKWTPAIKLLAPFNSLSNDYHVWFSEDLKTGYLTSDRGGRTKGIYSFFTDIPTFESPKPIKKTYYKYKIYDRKLDTVDTNLFVYSWSINDTLEIPGHEVIYRFPEPGTYVCKLNVYDIQLDTLVEGQTVKTLTIKLNEQAVIVCPDTIRVNTPVTFDGSQTFLPGFNIGRYVWDFGDGKFGQGREVEHSFLYPGKFRVVLGVEERKRNRRHEPENRSSFKDVVVLGN